MLIIMLHKLLLVEYRFICKLTGLEGMLNVLDHQVGLV